MNKLKVALQVLAGIQAFAPTAIIAGGCARDIAHGVEPKDFDVIVPLGTPISPLKEHLKVLADEGSYRAFVFGDVSTGKPYDEVDRVILCLKATIKGVDFDVLLYNVTEDALKAVDYFDANLSQYVLTKDGTPRFAGQVHPNERLVWVRGDANQKRMDYIRDKHRNFYPGLYEQPV